MYPNQLRIVFAVALSVVFCHCAQSQPTAPAGWPSHALTFITPAPAGGSVDVLARLVAENLAERIGRPVVVDSRPGADGIIAAEAFLGHTDKDHAFMVTFGGLLISNPVTYEKLPYDAERDFLPVSMLVTDTIALCANPGFSPDDLSQLVVLMRNQPDAVRWSSAPGEPRLRFLGLAKQVGASPLYVPYKANSQAITDLIAGRIDLMLCPLASALPNVRAGKLKLLAVMSPNRSPVVPNVPSAGEAGYPQLAMVPFVGLFARRGVDARVIERMNREIDAILADAVIRKRLVEAGLTPSPSSPAQLSAVISAKLQENRDLARLVGPLSR